MSGIVIFNTRKLLTAKSLTAWSELIAVAKYVSVVQVKTLSHIRDAFN